jgi:hypothetical protein
MAYTPCVVTPRALSLLSFAYLAVFLFALDLIVAFAVIGQDRSSIANQHSTIAALQATNQTLADGIAQAKNQRLFTIWNSCGAPCTIGPNAATHDNPVRVGGVPDTFDLILSFTSTTPVSVYFLTLSGWAVFDGTCKLDLSCVIAAQDNLHAGAIYYDRSLGPTTNLTDYTFKDAEGCASYVVVFQAAAVGIITPNERINYNPAATPTGACA